MKKSALAGTAFRIAVFYCTLAAACQGAKAQSAIPFRLDHDTVIVVSMMANGQGPFDFVLDTGTDTTIVDPSLARTLSLPSLDHIQLNTLAGTRISTRSSVRSLAAGPAQVKNLEVMVLDLAELRKVDSRIQGIAGQNFLSHFNYLLDYRKHAMHIETAHEIRDAIEGDQVPIEVSDNKMTVTSEARSAGNAKLRLILDSGTNSVVLFQKPSQNLTLAAQRSWLEVTSGGQTGAKVGRVDALTVGRQRFYNVDVVLPAADQDSNEVVADGVLPTALFQSLYVNNRESFVVLNPRARRK
ncbi:MAG: aspartyl protease family protein [Candidatus Acidiferrales bacterium]